MKSLTSKLFSVILCFSMVLPVVASCGRSSAQRDTSSEQSISEIIPSDSTQDASSDTFVSMEDISSAISSISSEESSVSSASSSSSSSYSSSSSSEQTTAPSTEESSSSTYSYSIPDQGEQSSDPEAVGTVQSVYLGDIRVQLLSSSLVRIEQKGPNGFENRPSYIVSNREDWEGVKYTLSSTSTENIINTAYFKVHVPKTGTAENVYVTTATDKKLYNYTGETQHNVYLPSPSEELKSWYFTDNPRIIPSEAGFSVDSQGRALQGWDFSSEATDIFVFLPNGDYTTFANDYVHLTGESEMVNLQTLGYWDSRWYAYSAETALKQINDYTSRGYSIDVLVIDTDWRQSSAVGGVGYEVNTTLFPNMAKFLQDCHNLGVNICFNDHPEPVNGTTNMLDTAEVSYRTQKLTMILSLGLDYWWFDRNWTVVLNSIDPDVSVYAFGMYAYQFVTQEYLESITDIGEYAERALIMGNVDGCLHGKWNYASDISAHRYSIQWTGDIATDSNALSQEIYASIFGGAEIGLPYMSSDIGGHTSKVSNDMYARWIQYGALSTICRVHCTCLANCGQEGRMPWLFGETAEEVTHTYVDMRYRLLPLFYALSYRNYTTGLPIMARTDIIYSDYVEASANDQYMLGDYVLIAPISSGEAGVKVPTSYLKNNNGASGLTAKYYNNNSWSGTPAYTKTDSNVFFNWGNSGPANLGADNFSVIWSGSITFGSKNACLAFYSDDTVIVTIDGVKVVDGTGVYDTMFYTPAYNANSTHTIEVKYIEYSGGAHVYMYLIEQTNGEYLVNHTRDVFIPDGSWIDVWTGTRYVGPYTYTVSHNVKTSPIFVREGSLITLAQNMTNTSAGNWANMALDVYPSKNFSAKTTLYEDDVTTVAYKDGKYRTTDIIMNYDNSRGSLVVVMYAAKGTFSGSRAFTERTWRVRLHANNGWGAINWIRVNGELVTGTLYQKSSSAKPFAFTGAALDGNVYEFVFSANVYTDYYIEINYASAVDSQIKTTYDKTALSFDLSVTDAGDGVNLSADNITDWISFGDTNNDIATKKGTTSNISVPSSYDSPWITRDSFFTKGYVKNGETYELMTAISSQRNFEFKITTIGKPAYYVLYLGGKYCTARVTVKDRAGNKLTEEFGYLYGSFTNRVVIHVTDSKVSTLYVTYAAHSSLPDDSGGVYTQMGGSGTGTGTITYVSVLCGLISESMPEIESLPEGNLSASFMSTATATGYANLSDCATDLGEATLDWMHFGSNGAMSRVSRINSDIITGVTFAETNYFNDYGMTLGYYDGDTLCAHTGTTEGHCAGGGEITVILSVTSNVKHVRLYTGAWKATNIIKVYNRKGTLLATSSTFTGGTTAACKIVTLSVSVSQNDILIIKINAIDKVEYGNVSLAALAVSGTALPTTATACVQEAPALSGNTDLTSGTTDWVYYGSGAEKANANNITSFNSTQFGALRNADNIGGTLSYTDGSDGSKSSLSVAKAFDYARFNVTVSANKSYLDLFCNVKSASIGFEIIASNGAKVASLTSVGDNTGATKSYKVRLLIESSVGETLTVVVYKGNMSSGDAYVGISAIALYSNVTPPTALTASASVADTTDTYLDRADSSLSTLYWEHYSESGTQSMISQTDYILSNTAETVTRYFSDYASISWTNGRAITSWIGNTNGVCEGVEFTISVKVTANVKAIKVYTGAWRATNTTSLWYNGNQVAVAPSFTAGDSAAKKVVTFNVNTGDEKTVTIKITPSDLGGSGNVSCVAVAVLGNAPQSNTTYSASRTEFTGVSSTTVNLTTVGTLDWFYLNPQDEKSGANYIDTSSLKVEGNNLFWDYKTAFTWTNGTNSTNNPQDDDIGSVQGTNNGKHGTYVAVKVNITSAVKHLILYIGGYESEYYAQIVNANGTVVFNELMHTAVGGTSFCYALDLSVNCTANETVTVVIYRAGNNTGNCSMSALAVQG